MNKLVILIISKKKTKAYIQLIKVQKKLKIIKVFSTEIQTNNYKYYQVCSFSKQVHRKLYKNSSNLLHKNNKNYR